MLFYEKNRGFYIVASEKDFDRNEYEMK